MKNQNVTYTERIDANNRNFFIDLKRAANDRDYVTITQSKPDGNDGYEYQKMVFFQEDIFRFQAALKNVIDRFEKTEDLVDEEYKLKVQKEFPNAFSKWSKEDETQLIELFNADSSVEQLSQHFMRSEKSIIARLKKNGLEVGLQAA